MYSFLEKKPIKKCKLICHPRGSTILNEDTLTLLVPGSPSACEDMVVPRLITDTKNLMLSLQLRTRSISQKEKIPHDLQYIQYIHHPLSVLTDSRPRLKLSSDAFERLPHGAHFAIHLQLVFLQLLLRTSQLVGRLREHLTCLNQIEETNLIYFYGRSLQFQ